jgi:hypothetical protein
MLLLVHQRVVYLFWFGAQDYPLLNIFGFHIAEFAEVEEEIGINARW